jgi:hypothetical protein
MANNNTEKQVKAVYVIRENGNGGNFWTRVGVAFVNRDSSLNVVLEALPTDGKLHIRDFKERQAE